MNKENKYIKRFMKSLFHRSLLFFGIILYSASISTISAEDNSKVTPPLIQGVWQFSSPMSDSDEGSFYALLGHASDALSAGLPADDFWHSNWHDGPQPSGSHYFQVEMINPSLLPNEIYFEFTRRPVPNDHTIEWSVRGTNNFDATKEACEELAHITTPFTNNTETLKSDKFNPKGYRYLRFYSEAQSGEVGSRGYFHLSRFQLYPAKAISSYEAALLAIEDGAIYCIFTEVNGQKYYIAADGTLTADKNGGNLYTFEKVSPLESEREYEYGFLINSNNNTRFSNPRTQATESFREGRLNVTTDDRDTWEAQVFFENSEGKFAIRSTNSALNGATSGWAWVGSAFWTAYEGEAQESPWVSALPDNGTFYLYNVESGMWLQNNHRARDYWTTFVQVGPHGFDFQLTKMQDGKFQINPRFGHNQSVNGGDDAYGYLDTEQEVTYWDLTKEDEGYVISANNGSHYLNVSKGVLDNVVDDDWVINDLGEDSHWLLITKEARLAELAKATKENGKDATWLIDDWDFANQNERWASWKNEITGSSSGVAFCDGFNCIANRAAECWSGGHGEFYQVITGIPNGTYGLTVQGFYRDGPTSGVLSKYEEGTEEFRGWYFANDATAPLMSICANGATEEVPDALIADGGFFNPGNGWEALPRATTAFYLGYYQNPELKVVVTDGTLRIGIRKESDTDDDWLCFDNFELTYYGNEGDLAGVKANLQNDLDEVAVNEGTVLPVLTAAKSAGETAIADTDATAIAAATTSIQQALPLAGYSFDQNYIWQIEKNTLATVTCNLIENGQVTATTTAAMPLGIAPIVPDNFKDKYHGLYDFTSDVQEVTTETTVVNFTPIWAGPFELSNSFASAKWYNMNIRSGWQVSKCATEPYTMKNNPTEEELASPEFQWAFVPVQDQLCQIIVYNRASGPNATLSKDGDNVVMRDGTYVWEIFSNYDGFVLREIGTEKWINQLGGGNTSCPLGLWDDSNGRSDDGSTFRVEEVLGLDQTPALVNGVYQLATPADLVWFAANAATEGLKGELTNAIDLSNTKWKPIGTKTAPFTGFFNGHLYPITGISNMLFGTTSGATITGVALESGNIEIPGKSDYAEHAGTIIGEAGTGAPTTLSFSYSKVNITTTGSGDTGGLSGKFYGTIYNCSYIGIISGEDTIGGMIGSSSEVATPANISNSYSYVESFGGSGWYKDALVGWLHDGSSMNNCYAIENVGSYAEHYNNATVNNVKTISKDVFTSGEVCFKLNEAQGKTVWFQTLGKDVHPVLDSTHGVVIKKADGNYANASNDGVVRIGTAEALVAYSAFINGGTDADAILTADIDMSGVDYTPIGCEANLFTNSFDGQGHIISNLTVTKGVDVSGTMGGVANGYVGLFGAVSGGATIKNFTLKNARLSGPAFIGVVGGSYGDGTVTIDAVGFEGEAIGTAQNVSGIIGVNMNSTATFHISNCYVTGKVAGGRESAAITGWTGGSQSTITNCWSTAEVSGNDAGKAFYRNDDTVWSDCYDIYGEQVNKIPEGALASGELAYKLNDNSADGAWRQTIGQDEHPVFAASSKKVYAKPSGGFRCDGLPLGNTTYTNNVVTPTISAHEYDGFICKNCGQINPEFVQPKNGVYALGTAEQLAWFARKVNSSADKALNAVLTADIDMSAYPGIENTIGTDNNGYAGTFDGQFHTIKVAYVNNADGGTEVRHSTALFRFLNGGTVKNIITTGTITTNQKYASGLVGKTQGNGGTMENVETHIVINSAVDGDGTHAGFLGVADAPATIITNALSAIVINGDRTTCCGGLIGWANQPVTFNKCLMVGEINVQDDGSATFSRNPGGNTYNNCYYRDGVKELQDNGNATKVSADVLKSGELTYSLNYPDVNGGIWRQNLDNGHTKDSHPVLSWEHGQVFKVAGGYTNKDPNANGFRYYMLEIDDIAGGDRIQISEFDFLDRNGKELESLRVTGGPNDFFSGESWTNLCDGETATKYCGPFRRSEGVYLYFDAQTIVKPVAYRIYTANDTKDFSERNPVSWKLWGSNTENKQPDHESWVLVDERMDDHTMQATNYMPYDFQIMPKCRYYQFVIEANGGDIAIQLSEFDLIDRNNQDVDPLVLYASTGHHYDNETQENLFDNDVMTKFCGMFTDKTIIYIDAGKPVALSGYRMTTANDTQSYPDRNPVSWSLLGSNTKSDRPNDDVWTLLDHHENDYTLGAVNYTPYTFFFNNSQPSLAGDVNADGNIDVADLTGVVSFILEDADASLIFSAADMDANGKVEVNDYAALVNVILSHGNNSVKARRIPSRQEALISLTAIGEDELLVSLMGDRQFTGIQFDLQLPEGVTLDEDGMVCESRQHGCWSVRREDGTYRVLCSSMTNAELRKGVVLRLKTKVDAIGETIISNVVLSDVNAKRHEAALVKTIISDTTGIMSEDLTTQTTAAFDLQGRRTNLQRKGIYIVNGKKVVIK